MQNVDKIVVTGGAGFIGSHLVDRLLAEKRAEVVALDNLSRGRLQNLQRHRANARFEFCQGDVRDEVAVADVVRGANVVFHLAALSTHSDTASDLDSLFTTNVVGTFNVLRAAARYDVGRVVFASCRRVYGEPIGLPVDEDHPLLTVDVEGASKISGEAFCRAFRRTHGLQTIVLRLADIYGPRDSGRGIANWVERSAAGQDLSVHGGKQVADYLWVDLAVEAFVRAATLDGPLPPINVGSGTGTRVVDAARRVARLAGGRGQVRLLPDGATGVTRFIANVDRMRQLLQIEPPLDPLGELSRMAPAAVDVAV
jgi:UDP-glucose 4-epimerase